MRQFSLTAGLTMICFLGFAQASYKETETMSINLLAGYQSLPPVNDINERLTQNRFENLKQSTFALGIEFTVTGKRHILKSQFRGTNIFVSQKVQRPNLQPASISLQYGIDFLRKAKRTYLFPFGGIRYANLTLFGKSSDGIELSADKNSFDFIAGLGLKQYLNDDLRGVFNNLDINFGFTLPITDGKWNKNGGQSDALFLRGSYKNRPSFFILFSIGRAFRPAQITPK